MKNDIIMYEKVYRILKNKIECGLLPEGTKLPSRAKLCEEFHTSEKTVRRVIDMLVKEGLVVSEQRKRPAVACRSEKRKQSAALSMKRADASAADDILRTGILLCYPLNENGMSLCRKEDLRIPEAMAANMDPHKPQEFWRLSNRIWRFFIARNENDLILRAVDSLGFYDMDPLPGTLEMRQKYMTVVKKLIQTLIMDGHMENVE